MDVSPNLNAPASTEAVNILLVDDQERNLEVLDSILRSEGYRLVHAISGSEALLALMKQDFAAIVLDIQMPELNGIELARLIKQRKRNQHIPILFLTAFFQEDTEILQGYTVGAVDYLTKPINPQILRSKIAVFVELFQTTRALARANTLLGQEIAQRRIAQEELHRVNAELETHVQQRTAELIDANRALRRSEEQFRRAVEDSPIPVIMQAEDGEVLQISKTWADMTGYTLQDAESFDAWLTGAYGIGGNEVRNAVRRIFERDTGMGEVEFEIVTRSGHKRIWSFTASAPGTLLDGRRFVVGMAKDITERKQADALLRQSEQRYRNLVHALPAAIYTCDPTGRIVLYNRAAVDLWGREPDLDADLWCGSKQIYLPDGTPVTVEDCPMAQAIRTRRPNSGQEVLIERPDLSRRAVMVYPRPLLDAEGEVLGGINMLVDITELKNVEVALKEAKETAEAASKAKDDFLAALSHELRTPLNPALLLAGDRERDEKLPAEVRADFSVIRREIETEARLIDDLLDITRISRGKLRLRPEPVSINDLVRASWDRLKTEAAHKHLDVVLQLATDSPWVHADVIRLQQVLWNIMRNAVRFTPPGGRIVIRTGCDSATQCWVEIQDSGMGIDPKDLERIFLPFEQGKDGHQAGGLGLGLAISHRLVELHDGAITATSAGRDEGAIFIIRLPAVLPPPETKTSRPELPSRVTKCTKALRILLVEDHAQTRNALARLLTQRGHQVATADSIEQALETAQQFTFDLLLSDLGLPDGSGNQLVTQLRRRQIGFRGIALSGYGMESDVRESLEAGFSAHLTKPVDMQALEKLMVDDSEERTEQA